MQVTIFIDGVKREYGGEYHELHNIDWNEHVQDLLDNVHEHETANDK